MLEAMPSRLFSEWLAYYGIEPFGEERADYRAAMGVAATYNVWRGKGQRAIQPVDMMPRFDEPPEKPKRTPEEVEAIKRQMRRFLRHGKD